MWFTIFIEQDVSRLNVTVQNSMFVRIMHGARYLCDEFRRASNWHRFALHHFVKLAAFDELHAKVALAIALAYLIDRNNTWMIEAGCRFCFTPKPLQVRFGRPRPYTNYLQRNGAIETFLPRPINYALTTPAKFL